MGATYGKVSTLGMVDLFKVLQFVIITRSHELGNCFVHIVDCAR